MIGKKPGKVFKRDIGPGFGKFKGRLGNDRLSQAHGNNDEERDNEEQKQPDIGRDNNDVAPGLAVKPVAKTDFAGGQFKFPRDRPGFLWGDTGHGLILQENCSRRLKGKPNLVFPLGNAGAFSTALVIHPVDADQSI